MPVLRLLRGAAAHRKFFVGPDGALVGRDAAKCEICIGEEKADKSGVSREHARIVKQDDGYFIFDCESTNGTQLNGKPLVAHTIYPLRHNDLIRVREFLLRFEQTATERSAHTKSSVEEGRPPVDSDIDSKLDLSSSSWEALTAINTEAKLRALFEIASNLRAALTLDEVLSKVLDSLLKTFVQADHGIVALRGVQADDDLHTVARQRPGSDAGQIVVSRAVMQHVLSRKEAIVWHDVRIDPQFAASASLAGCVARSIMCAPMFDRELRPLGILQLAARGESRRFSRTHLDLLAAVALQVAVVVENARLHEAALQARTIERDLELAQEIQLGLLPDSAPQIDGYEFFEFYSPARAIGGDYYDYVSLRDGRLAILLADVAGKGISAALIMALLSSLMRAYLESEMSPLDAVHRANLQLAKRCTEGKFVTLLMLLLDPNTHEIQVVNAGHWCPLIRRRDGTVEFVGESETGLPLGVDCDSSFAAALTYLNAGESLVLFTDGILDAVNQAGSFYGFDRLGARLAGDPETAPQLGRHIVDDVHRFAGNYPQFDDICLLCLSRTP